MKYFSLVVLAVVLFVCFAEAQIPTFEPSRRTSSTSEGSTTRQSSSSRRTRSTRATRSTTTTTEDPESDPDSDYYSDESSTSQTQGPCKGQAQPCQYNQECCTNAAGMQNCQGGVCN